MKHPLAIRLGIVAAAAAVFALAPPAARADGVTFSVNTNTSSISGSSTYEVAFLLIDASGSGDANNTVTINNFAFGGGSPGTVDLTESVGDFTGDLTSTVTLTDSQVLNSFASTFTAGSQLSFTVNMTTNPDGSLPLGLAGDQFGFFLLDSTGTPIPTTNACGPDDTGECALLLATVQSDGTLDIQSFSSDVTGPVQVSNTPEPATLLLLATGSAFALLRRKRSSL